MPSLQCLYRLIIFFKYRISRDNFENFIRIQENQKPSNYVHLCLLKTKLTGMDLDTSQPEKVMTFLSSEGQGSEDSLKFYYS